MKLIKELIGVVFTLSLTAVIYSCILAVAFGVPAAVVCLVLRAFGVI